MEAYETLERELAPFCGSKHVVACSSGTAALHLALETLNLKAGSEVILPDFAMVACAAAVRLARLTPVFVDCGPDLNIRPELVRKADSDRARVLMVVHTYGRLCDTKSLHEVADERSLMVVEDMAEAHCLHPHKLTDIGCWSFYRNKLVAGEEGGCIAVGTGVFEHKECPSGDSGAAAEAARARSLRSLGFTPSHDYDHVPFGCNYRLSNANAELIRASLARSRLNFLEREGVCNVYDQLIDESWRMPRRDSPWVYDVRLPHAGREKLRSIVRMLNGQGVAARLSFKPLSRQSEFKLNRRVGGAEADRASEEVMYLPVDPSMDRPRVTEVVSLFRKAASACL